ncbi:uncharacterized protein [Dermacentor albipictus]|uniref:uncharacterized protein isoform X4 n=1 Tax=Dermacentor albipictus TaxID=60249 RepID=UPI0038FC30EE
MLRLCIDEPLSRSCSANFVDNDFFKDGMVLAKCVIKVSWLSKSDANLKSQYTGPPQHTSIRFPSSVNSASRKRRHAWKTWKGWVKDVLKELLLVSWTRQPSSFAIATFAARASQTMSTTSSEHSVLL